MSTMDWQGQLLSDKVHRSLSIAFAVLSFITGWILEDLQKGALVGLVGLALGLVLCIPPWPMYRRNPITWLSDPAIPKQSKKNK